MISPKNLIGYWSFDDGNQDYADDLSENDNRINLFNKPQVYRDIVPFSDFKGKSMRFHDLSNQYGQTSNSSIELNPEKNDFSISFWFKIWNIRDTSFLISKGNKISTENGWAIFLGIVEQ